MKTIKEIGAWVGSLTALTLCLHAGSIQTVPPYDNTSYAIPVGPGSDGSANVYFNVTSTDPTVTVSGTFTNATNPSASFTQSGSVYTATANYAASQAGTSNPVTITITTSDAGGACTSSLWHPHSSSRYSFLNFYGSSNYLADFIANFAQFIPRIASLKMSLTGNNPSILLKQTTSFTVLVLKPRLAKDFSVPAKK